MFSFNFHKLFSRQSLFTINPLYLSGSDKLFLAIGCAFVVIAIVFKIAATFTNNPVDKIVRNKFFDLFVWIGALEIIWFGARWENVEFFDTHFVALVILLIGLVWFVWLVISLIKNYRGDKEKWDKEQVKLKYLPK